MTIAGAGPRHTVASSLRRGRFAVFTSLERDWGRLVASPSLREAEKRWWVAEPALRGLRAAEIVARVAWSGYSTSDEGVCLLSSLLRISKCGLASRCLLQALLPRMEAENVYTPTFGFGVGEQWRHPGDVAAELVAECFAAIVRHSGQEHEDVARLVVGEATRRMRTARQAERRHQQRTVHLDGLGAAFSVDLFGTRSVAEWLASAVISGLREGRLTEEQAALLYATRVKGLPASEAGRLRHLAPRAVYYALSMAERALVGRAA